MRNGLAAALAALLLAASSNISGAQEVTLKGITAFAEKTLNSRSFERFIEMVNAEGKGKVRIDYIGGPKAMPWVLSMSSTPVGASNSNTRR